MNKVLAIAVLALAMVVAVSAQRPCSKLGEACAADGECCKATVCLQGKCAPPPPPKKVFHNEDEADVEEEADESALDFENEDEAEDEADEAVFLEDEADVEDEEADVDEEEADEEAEEEADMEVEENPIYCCQGFELASGNGRGCELRGQAGTARCGPGTTEFSLHGKGSPGGKYCCITVNQNSASSCTPDVSPCPAGTRAVNLIK